MKKKGFTLIELIIVMAILAILIGIGAQTFSASIRKSRDVQRKGNLKAIANALEYYYNDQGQYPASNASGQLLGCGGLACTPNSTWQDANGTMYMQSFPGDPSPAQNYFYLATMVNGKYIQYQLYARLENTQDSQCLQGNCTNPTVPAGVTCGTLGVCNYGISSANASP